MKAEAYVFEKLLSTIVVIHEANRQNRCKSYATA